MSVYKPEIITVSFEEGDFDFIWCTISIDCDGESSVIYESFIGIDVDVPDITKASPAFQDFDVYKVFTYVSDLQDFFRCFIEGGADYKILGYESTEDQTLLFNIDEWDEIKNDYTFWSKI